MENIAVFFGGNSPEHDISVITGVLTLNSLDRAVYNPIPIYVEKDGSWVSGEELNKLSAFKQFDEQKAVKVCLLPGDDVLYAVKGKKIKQIGRIRCAINCMHGLNGEDGMLAALMQSSGIAIVSPGMFASSVAIDKDFTKTVLAGLQIETIPYVRIFRDNYFGKKQATHKRIEEKLGFPVIVKPARLGSSIGIKKAENAEELHIALSKAFNYDVKVVCERYVPGSRDINCAAYRSGGVINVSMPEEVLTQNDILTFADKYKTKGTVGSSRVYPAPIGDEKTQEIRAITEKIYRKLDMEGLVRFDFLLYGDKLYLNEINCIPGSLAYYFFCNTMAQFSALLTNLINDAERRLDKERILMHSFESGVLSGEFTSIKK